MFMFQALIQSRKNKLKEMIYELDDQKLAFMQDKNNIKRKIIYLNSDFAKISNQHGISVAISITGNTNTYRGLSPTKCYSANSMNYSESTKSRDGNKISGLGGDRDDADKNQGHKKSDEIGGDGNNFLHVP